MRRGPEGAHTILLPSTSLTLDAGFMPARSRVFSELLAEDESENGSPLSNFGLRPQDLPRVKRHKKNGMNARFDRMVAAMNVTHSPSSSSSKSQGRSRSRTGSSSASGSVISYGPPDTPVDSYYDGLKAGALGEGFSVLKMKSNPGILDSENYASAREANESDSPLPEWLSDTFSTLSKDHPLRMLIPESYTPPRLLEQESENLFAYNTVSRSTRSRSHDRALSRLANGEKPDLSSPINFQTPYLSTSNADETPFSKPGPASSVMPSPIAPSSTPYMLLPPMPTAGYHSPALLHPLSHPQIPPAIRDPHYLESNALRHDSALSSVSRSSSPMTKRMSSAGHIVCSSTTQPEMASDTFVSGYRKMLPSPEPDLHYTHSDHDSASATTLHHSAGSDFPFIPASPPPPFSQPSSPQPIHHASCFSLAPPTSDSFQSSGFSNVSAFSTPGPGYYTSRPSDSAPDSSSSDPVVEDNFDMDVDVVELGFQWTAFNRKEVDSEAGREPPQSKPALKFRPCLRPRPDVYGVKETYSKLKHSFPAADKEPNISAQAHSSAVESPNSSDVPKLDVVLRTRHHQDYDYEDDHFHGENSAGLYAALDRHHESPDLHKTHYPDELQVQQPESSDLNQSQPDDEFTPTPRQMDPQDLPGRPDTACPFAYSAPPLSSSADTSQPKQIGMEQTAEKPMHGKAELAVVGYAHNTEFGYHSDSDVVQDPRTPTPPPPVFAPAPGIYISPLRGSSSVDESEQVKDRDADREGFSTIKSRLLDALDRVCKKGRSRLEYANEAEESSESSQLSTSTDSIESWGDG